MVQVLKSSVRDQIIAAAKLKFAQEGFRKATMSAIAQEAGLATGTIYKYFSNKKTLFHSIVTNDFISDFKELTGNRIAAFAQPDGLVVGRSGKSKEADSLIRFWIRHRLEVVIVLAKAEGSEYETFAQKYIQDMVSQTMRQAREQFDQKEFSSTFRFMVNKILADSVRGIALILESFEDEESIYEAFAASTAYQLGGINALIEWNCRGGVKG